MAFDGFTIAALVAECNEKMVDGRIFRINQPEDNELILTIKNNREQFRLLLSVEASLPIAYFTEDKKKNPLVAPNFCMLLRKHIQNARILSVTQPDFERIIRFELEHLNELGDICKKYLIVELMGKHSNIIFIDDENKIIDSIKHIPKYISSVREVLPGREYFVPKTGIKYNPLTIDGVTFKEGIAKSNELVYKAIYEILTGISPIIAKEICRGASVGLERIANGVDDDELEELYGQLLKVISKVRCNDYIYNIYYEDSKPLEYSVFPLVEYEDCEISTYASVSELLETFYREKNVYIRIRQKSIDLRKIVQTALERNQKKYKLQRKQLEDSQKKDVYKTYGELLITYSYSIVSGSKKAELINYYDNSNVTIALDEDLSVMDNAKRYFDKYAKLKRTFEALSKLTIETESEIEHLESISNSLDIAMYEEDLYEIKEELIRSGYIKRKNIGKVAKSTSKPFHYMSSSGDDIYVGKNNIQNEMITFQLANGNDWWFHAKGIPGSHVVVKSIGDEIDDATYEEAASLAAYYSKARGSDKVDVDYTQRKNIKKPAGSRLGFVIYNTNYSLVATSDISKLKNLSE